MYGTFSQLSDEAKVELWSYMALKYTNKLGIKSINRLCRYYGSAHQAVLGFKSWGAYKISSDIIYNFRSETWRKPAKEEWKKFKLTGCGVVLPKDFPALLNDIIDAPLYLYYWGDISLLFGSCLAVVGSRRCSRDGLDKAAVLSKTLASIGFTVVSGLALGIDREAHLAALSELGSSIAVLGTGINRVYPKANIDVFNKLINDGLIISELAPDFEADARQFPVRNRIISALSFGVVVVEAAYRSGSLITARHALEQNRQVYAMPGSPDAENSVGCQELLRQGAVIVRNVGDILVDLKDSLSVILNKKLESTQKIEEKILPSDDSFLDYSYNKLQKEEVSKKTIEQRKEEFKRLIADDQLDLNDIKIQDKIILNIQPTDKVELDEARLDELKNTLSELEFNILNVLLNNHKESLHIDKIVELLNKDSDIFYEVSKVSGTLTILEISGLVCSQAGLRYTIK